MPPPLTARAPVVRRSLASHLPPPQINQHIIPQQSPNRSHTDTSSHTPHFLYWRPNNGQQNRQRRRTTSQPTRTRRVTLSNGEKEERAATHPWKGPQLPPLQTYHPSGARWAPPPPPPRVSLSS